MFLSVFCASAAGSAQGFRFVYNGSVAAEFSFSGGFSVYEGFEENFEQTENGVYFYPDAENRAEYNLIVIDEENKTLSVKETTCAGRQCLSQSVSVNGGFIYCAPHGLKISPIGFTDPTTG